VNKISGTVLLNMMAIRLMLMVLMI